MKSRTSFFNFPAFRKDLTRFAPAWGLYCVGLLLIFTVLMAENTAYYRANNLLGLIPFMAVINFCYGILSAQLLFGDLCSSRMCYALHAMPLRRETWFGTHVAAGLCFSLVPNLVFTLVCMATMNLGAGWSVPLWCLLAAELQYLCFFGLGVLCMMLTGNRLAGGVVYGLVNFFSMLVYWLVDSLYEPLLTGIRVRQDPFLFASPVVKLAGEPDMVNILRERITDSYGNFNYWEVTGVTPGQGWGWAAIYAAVGILALVAALLLYRRRDLERAGDFMAFAAGEPVLLVVYTLTVGGIFHLMSDVFSGGLEKYLFLMIGLAVGYFTGLMLLQRTVRVFRLKAAASFAVFTAIFLASLGITALDPLGLTQWVPSGDEVASVNLSNRYDHYNYSEHDMDLTDPEAIRNMIAVHEDALTDRSALFEESGYIGDVNVCIEYTLKNGKVRTRFYEVPINSQAGKILKPYFSSFEYVTGFREEDIPAVAKTVSAVYTDGFYADHPDYEKVVEKLDFEELLRCIAADCAAGTMAQREYYHVDDAAFEDLVHVARTGIQLDLNYHWPTGLGYNINYIYINVYEDSVHTFRWLKDNGLYDETRLRKLG